MIFSFLRLHFCSDPAVAGITNVIQKAQPPDRSQRKILTAFKVNIPVQTNQTRIWHLVYSYKSAPDIISPVSRSNAVKLSTRCLAALRKQQTRLRIYRIDTKNELPRLRPTAISAPTFANHRPGVRQFSYFHRPVNNRTCEFIEKAQ